MRIAIVGGTGPFGTALATRLREVPDIDVVIGSRERERAEATAAEIGVSGATNEDAVRSADLAVLATKAEAAVETARTLRNAIGATPVLCVASELRVTREGVFPSSSPVSVAERVQAELDAPVVAGLHSLAATSLTGTEASEEDAFVCGDDPEAKALALRVAEHVTAGRGVDAGPLAGARALEGLTAILVGINRRCRTHAGIRVTGLE